MRPVEPGDRYSVDDVGISDHELVSADLNLHRPAPNTRRITYRNIKAVNPVKFTELIGAEKMYASPPADVDAFADELDAYVTRLMDSWTCWHLPELG